MKQYNALNAYCLLPRCSKSFSGDEQAKALVRRELLPADKYNISDAFCILPIFAKSFEVQFHSDAPFR